MKINKKSFSRKIKQINLYKWNTILNIKTKNIKYKNVFNCNSIKCDTFENYLSEKTFNQPQHLILSA